MNKLKKLQLRQFVDKIDLSQGIDLSTVFKEILPNKHFIFKEGGPHYFWQCESEDVPFPYNSFVWPFVITNIPKTNSYNVSTKRIMFGSIALSKMSYPVYRLQHATKTRVRRSFRKLDKIEELVSPWEMEMGIHRVVAKAFCNGYEKNKIVDHIDGNRVNYMPQNLRWITLQENSFGTPSGRNDPDEVFRRIKEKDWWKGKSNNMVESSKKIYERLQNVN